MDNDKAVDEALANAKSCEGTDEGDCGTGAITLAAAVLSLRHKLKEVEAQRDYICRQADVVQFQDGEVRNFRAEKIQAIVKRLLLRAEAAEAKVKGLKAGIRGMLHREYCDNRGFGTCVECMKAIHYAEYAAFAPVDGEEEKS